MLLLVISARQQRTSGELVAAGEAQRSTCTQIHEMLFPAFMTCQLVVEGVLAPGKCVRRRDFETGMTSRRAAPIRRTGAYQWSQLMGGIRAKSRPAG